MDRWRDRSNSRLGPGGKAHEDAHSFTVALSTARKEGAPLLPGGLSAAAKTAEAGGHLGSSQHLKPFLKLLAQPLRPSAKHFLPRVF